jgi:hypothetical protein
LGITRATPGGAVSPKSACTRRIAKLLLEERPRPRKKPAIAGFEYPRKTIVHYKVHGSSDALGIAESPRKSYSRQGSNLQPSVPKTDTLSN